MFDELSSKLNATLQRLTGRGVLTEDAVKEGLREIRRILLEADVSFDLTRDFLERVQAKAVGVLSIKEVRPGHQIVKIVYDELVALLGEKQAPIAYASVPPTVILLVGLQGSGKTTTAGKLARRLKLEQKAPFLVAADCTAPRPWTSCTPWVARWTWACTATTRRRMWSGSSATASSPLVRPGLEASSWIPRAGSRSTTK